MVHKQMVLTYCMKLGQSRYGKNIPNAKNLANMMLLLLITLQKHHITLTVKMWWLDGATKQVLTCHSKLHQSHLLQKKILQMKKFANITLLFTSDAPLQ